MATERPTRSWIVNVIDNFYFFFRFTKPVDFADCVGDELPLGWEMAYDPQIGAYYINHVDRKYWMLFFGLFLDQTNVKK